MKSKKQLIELKLNKDLTMNQDYKKVITEAEKGRYKYFDYSKEIIQEIAVKELNDLKWRDCAILVQALFPKYLVCSGLFDSFLMFEIKNNNRVDPPKYCYSDLASFLNNNEEAKVNHLATEIVDLFKINSIGYNKQWDKYLSLE